MKRIKDNNVATSRMYMAVHWAVYQGVCQGMYHEVYTDLRVVENIVKVSACNDVNGAVYEAMTDHT